MKTKMLLASLLVTGTMTLGCATAGSSGDYDTAKSEAKAAQKKAASVGGEWRDTGKILKQADKAAAAGDTAKAVKLANKAKKQGEMGYQQAMDQANAGPRI